MAQPHHVGDGVGEDAQAREVEVEEVPFGQADAPCIVQVLGVGQECRLFRLPVGGDDLPEAPEDDGEEGDQDGEVINVKLAKHRNGPTGEIQLWFKKSQTRFQSYAGQRYAEV